MFDNIGGKIKGLAVITTIIGMVCSIIYGFVLMCTSSELALVGLLVAGLGCLFSWISSFSMYALGELVSNSEIMVSNTYRMVEWQKEMTNQTNNTVTKKITSTVHGGASHHTWICGKCGQEIDQKPCKYCGNGSEYTVHPFPIKVLRVDDNSIQCPVCKTVQSINNLHCCKCSQKFENDFA